MGSFNCPEGTEANVYLGDATGTSGQKISFDAMKFRYLYPTEINEQIPQVIDFTAFPNPFNSNIEISAPENSRIKIFNISGEQVYSLDIISNETIRWTPQKNMPSGVYQIAIEKNGQKRSRLIQFIK